jgi:Helix-turn-helix domain
MPDGEDSDLAPFRQTLADLLATLRKEAGLTQQQVADRLGYSRATVAGAETGHRQPGEAFWIRCDDLLAPGRQLRSAYAQLATARRDRARRLARQTELEREARVARWRAGHGLPADPPALTAATTSQSADHTGSRGRSGASAGEQSRPSANLAPTTRWTGGVPVNGCDESWEVDRLGVDTTAAATVGAGDVRAIRSMLDALTASDRLFGSVRLRPFATGYLAEVVLPRLNTAGAGLVSHDMFAVATEFLLRVAAMHLDAGQMRSCRSLLRVAGSVADETDDLCLTAWVLARRGELEVYDHKPDRAVAYAAAAAAMAAHAPPAARAFILTKHALALSAMGDAAVTRETLGDATEVFSRAGSADEPRWMNAYGWGHLRHDEGRCYINLGLGTQAVDAADESMQIRSRDRYPRPHAFSLGIQAIGHAQGDNVDQACDSGHQLLAVAAGLDSQRIRTRLAELLRALADHSSEPAVRDLRDAARPILACSPSAERLS